MKPNDIDKLFANRLRNLEQTPSADAWERLNSQMQGRKSKKKRALWIYASAAAITLLLISVLLVHQYQYSPKQPDIASAENQLSVPMKDTQEKPLISVEKNNLAQVDTPTQENLLVVEKAKKKTSIIEKAAPEPTVNPVGKERKSRSLDVDNVVIQAQPVEEIAKLDKPEPVKADLPVLDNLPSALPQANENTLVVVVQLAEEEDGQVQTDIDESSDEAKTKKANGLLSTLKKIKKGEFRELGIRPEEVLAYVKEKTNKP